MRGKPGSGTPCVQACVPAWEGGPAAEAQPAVPGTEGESQATAVRAGDSWAEGGRGRAERHQVPVPGVPTTPQSPQCRDQRLRRPQDLRGHLTQGLLDWVLSCFGSKSHGA